MRVVGVAAMTALIGAMAFAVIPYRPSSIARRHETGKHSWPYGQPSCGRAAVWSSRCPRLITMER